MTNASPELPVAQPASWREAGALVVALVAFVCISDVQGVLWHRSEYRSAAHWVLPGVSYAFAAGLALWRWDWVVRVALSGRFVLLLAGAIAAIWAASAVPDARATAERREGVPVLRAGERERRTLVERTPVAAMVDWQTPQISHMDARQAQQAASQDSSFVHELPTGWTRMAPSAMRLVNLRVAGDPRAECYLTSLPGAAGGLLDNVNRWRSQMGLGPIDSAALAKLPRTKLLGREAVLVELDGTFDGGMGGTGPIPDARMVGAIASLPAVTVFLKMTGPRDVVERERAGFDLLLSTLRMPGMPADSGSAETTRAKADRKGEAASAGARGGAQGFRWQVPDGWEKAADRPMRLVTFTPRGAAGAECYVTVLPGDAGGVLQNVNRWREQVGAGPLTQAQVAALPKVALLGSEAPIVEAAGTFQGMNDGPREGFAVLGTLASAGDAMVFVKMTGPQDVVRAERERFLAFCRSLAVE